MAQQQPRGPAMVVDLTGWRDRRGRFGKLDAAAVEAQRQALRGELRTAVRLAQEESPVGKGGRAGGTRVRFRDSWHGRTTATRTGANAELYNSAPHARFVILPTRAHEIRPRRARFLRFEVNGRTVYARRVWHPGTKGNDVPGRVLRQMEPRLRETLDRVARTITAAVRDTFR